MLASRLHANVIQEESEIKDPSNCITMLNFYRKLCQESGLLTEEVYNDRMSPVIS